MKITAPHALHTRIWGKILDLEFSAAEKKQKQTHKQALSAALIFLPAPRLQIHIIC